MTTALLISGGVDSAVACHLLVSRGIRPHLFHIRIVQPGESPDCTAEEDIELSRLTARLYDLPHSVVDLSREYRDRVTDYVILSLRLGRTPNPDTLCNPLIKFGAFEEAAGKDFDAIATGRARINLKTFSVRQAQAKNFRSNPFVGSKRKFSCFLCEI